MGTRLDKTAVVTSAKKEATKLDDSIIYDRHISRMAWESGDDGGDWDRRGKKIGIERNALVYVD